MGKTSKWVTVKTTVGDAISTAYSIIEDLAAEMRDAYDNTPESLQSSAVGEARGEAADTLEGIDQPDVPKKLSELPLEFKLIPLKRHASRSDRLDDGLEYARAAVEAMDALLDLAKGEPGA